MIDRTFVSAEYGHKTRVRRRESGDVMLAVTPSYEPDSRGRATYLLPDEAREIAAALIAAADEPAFKLGDVVETSAGNVGFVCQTPTSNAEAIYVRDAGTETRIPWPTFSLTLLERDGKPVDRPEPANFGKGDRARLRVGYTDGGSTDSHGKAMPDDYQAKPGVIYVVTSGHVDAQGDIVLRSAVARDDVVYAKASRLEPAR